ncbi:MAG: DUF4007 family protein [Treponema sp.]|nr:DUF4007 family protein [Treponema sp.]
MKFRAHETFFIRKGWLSKGMKYVKNTNGTVFIDRENNPMDVLGIGSNMVKSLRYWLMATGLTSEPNSGKRTQSLTELGKLIFKNDRYIEENGTLQLLQYKLATNKENATSWYFFFNGFNLSEFTQEDFITDVQKFIKAETKVDEKEVGTLRTLSDDFACILGTYLPRASSESEKSSPENNISCPFSELSLLTSLGKGLYKKSIPSPSSFSPYVILAVIADRCGGKSEIRLNELLNAECNIGRVFNLDTITLIEILRQAEKTGELKIIRTAGLDVIRLSHPENGFLFYAEKFYESLAEEK